MLENSSFVIGRGNLPVLTLQTPTGASMDIYRHGAHLTSWKSATGKEWMFLSKQAVFAEGSAIRGGVPVVFPQFSGFGSGQRHGFARNLAWQLAHTDSASERSQCTFVLEENEATQARWPYRFRAEFTPVLHNDCLSMTLSIRNTDTQAFTFSAALHTYFAINHIHAAKLRGLTGITYWDNDGSDFQRDRFVDEKAELDFPDAIDRVYFNCQTPLQLIDGDDHLTIQAQGFSEVVVWNPGAAATQQLQDMADDEYQNMLCVEAAVIDKPITLAPGEAWSGTQQLQQGAL
jgi:glucose-6-phosphate 1-epimerase